jgi:hypothetical protein
MEKEIATRKEMNPLKARKRKSRVLAKIESRRNTKKD